MRGLSIISARCLSRYLKVWAFFLMGFVHLVCGIAVHAETPAPSYSTFGTPGLIDLPTATSLPDATLAATLSHFRNNTRATIAFQVTPRLTASFRYATLDGLGGVRDALFDRSFDVHFRLWPEGRIRPAVAVGLRDFVGTGVYSSEYVVATKTVGSRVQLTAGMGWGRLATEGGFDNPLGALDERFETRPKSSSTQLGGQIESTQWFRGNAAVFGGVAWQATNRLQLKAEWSSDAYVQEVAGGLINRRNSLNLGLDYRLRRGTRLHAYYLYGDAIGIGVTFQQNATTSRAPSGTHPAPFPVRVRDPRAPVDLGWQTDPGTQTRLRTILSEAMRNEGLEIEGFALKARSARIDIRNTRYNAPAEAIGRTARVLTQALPDSVDSLQIVLVELGLATVSVTLDRADLEQFEHSVDGAEAILARADIDAAPVSVVPRFDPALYPRFVWGLGPYFRVSLFDPDMPIRTDFGLQLNAELNLARGLYIAGSLRHRLAGNIGDDIRPSNSVLPRVRSEAGRFAEEGTTALDTLTISYFFRAGPDLYGRLTAGYLEPHFGGVSGELLWKRVDSRFALGVELNYVKQRDFDQRFGFQDYEVATGHASAYWDLGNGFQAQVDVGRYLAGDWGATVSVDRTFRNGWRVGAYATVTDVSFQDFGEGSFDKGLRFVIPLEPLLGRPTRRRFASVLQPLSRDGGARVHVDGRLYETVRAAHRAGLESSWGRFWR